MAKAGAVLLQSHTETPNDVSTLQTAIWGRRPKCHSGKKNSALEVPLPYILRSEFWYRCQVVDQINLVNYSYIMGSDLIAEKGQIAL